MKYVITILITLSLLLCVVPGYCARGNVQGIASGNQDYLLLATVADINNTSITLDVYHSIHMNDEKEDLTVDKLVVDKFKYSYCDEHSDIYMSPRMGDNVFISLNKGDRYYVANGAYKISSVDHKMLTFYASESMKGSDCITDIVALANFVRTDGSRREFKFENGNLTTYIDGKPLILYPTDNISESITFVDYNGQIIEGAKTKDVIAEGEKAIDDTEEKADYRWLVSYLIIALGVVVGGIVVYNTTARDRINRKKDMFKKSNK